VLQERVREIEVMLGMVLRLPEGSGKKARLEAFKGAVDSMIENAEQRGLSGFKEVDSKYQQVCVCVCVCKGSCVLCTSHTSTVEVYPLPSNPSDTQVIILEFVSESECPSVDIGPQ
jgi:hypothetical protein